MPGELTQAQALAFEEEVRKIRVEVLEQDVPALETFQMFDVETDVPLGAKEFGSDMITRFGKANVIAMASDDLNFAEVGLYRQIHKVILLGIAYRWHHQEVLQQALTGRVPRRLRGVAARDIILRELNTIGFEGKPSYGVHGFLTFPGIPRHVMSTTISSSDTADDILDDLFDLITRPILDTENVAKPTDVGLPLDKFLNIATRPRSSTSDTTILQFFMREAEGILGRRPRVMGSWQFKKHNVCAAWTRGRTATNKLVIPANVRFSQLDVQVNNFEYKVPCWANTGGWYTEYPLYAVIGEFES